MEEKKAIETNESVLSRKVVAFGERKTLGPVAGLRVNCDTMSVGWYIVGGSATGSPRVLPLENSVGVGDTFLTIQSKNVLLPAGPETKSVTDNGFKLLDCKVFSRGGNELGIVTSFEYEPVLGTITTIRLDKNTAFGRDNFMFFDPEYVFVDDGKKTVSDLRESDDTEEAVEGGEVADDSQVVSSVSDETSKETVSDDVEGAKSEPSTIEDTAPDDAVAELREYLLGKKTVSECKTTDGSFSVPVGTTLTQELIDKSQENDALVLLVMCVEG